MFGDGRPLQWMRNRYGNTIHFSWSTIGQGTTNLLKLTSTNGQHVKFTYGTSNRITQAKDNMGRCEPDAV